MKKKKSLICFYARQCSPTHPQIILSFCLIWACIFLLPVTSQVLGIQRSVVQPGGAKAGQAAPHTDAVTIVKRRDDIGKRASGLPKNLSDVRDLT
jgi:hypothetical protein